MRSVEIDSQGNIETDASMSLKTEKEEGKEENQKYEMREIDNDTRKTIRKHIAGIVWMAPFFSGGGYCSEAIAYVQSLVESGFDVSIEHFGDSINYQFLRGLPESQQLLLQTLYEKPKPKPNIKKNKYVIMICHSEPGNVLFAYFFLILFFLVVLYCIPKCLRVCMCVCVSEKDTMCHKCFFFIFYFFFYVSLEMKSMV